MISNYYSLKELNEWCILTNHIIYVKHGDVKDIFYSLDR